MQPRAIATRRRILDATVGALVRSGYGGTTTQEVCRRAEVSRGTLQYHFTTRIDLLVAALDHVLNEVVTTFVATRAAEAPVEPAALVPQMWTQWQGPALTAWLELAVAARTTPELRAPMREVMLRFDEVVRGAFDQLLGTDALPVEWRSGAPFLVFAVMNGLAVGRSYEAPGHEAPVLELLARLMETVVGADRWTS